MHKEVDFIKIADDPEACLAAHGKSFYFSSLVFNRRQRFQVATLYGVCRYIDDCADELPVPESKKIIAAIKTALSGDLSDPEKLKSFSRFMEVVATLESWGVDRHYLLELIRGAEFDLHNGQVISEADLDQYCFRVAGVVGLMMCPLIGVADQQAARYAASLGLAMQLTNICRDVREDLDNGRIYLPESRWHRGIDRPQFFQAEATPAVVATTVADLLLKADRLYCIAYKGLAFIPLRPRLCILLAGEVYRAIGVKIRQQGHNVLKGRVYLSTWEKVIVAFKTLPHIFRLRFWRQPVLKENAGEDLDVSVQKLFHKNGIVEST